MADDVRVLKQDEELTVDDQGRLKEQIRIAFKVGDDGPFLLRFDKAGFSALAARGAVETFAAELRAMRGGR